MLTRSIAALIALIATCLPTPTGAQSAPTCDCKDLPAMVKEVIEQEFLESLFRFWSVAVPLKTGTSEDMSHESRRCLERKFYNKEVTTTTTCAYEENWAETGAKTEAKTTEVAHVALETDIDNDCGIKQPVYGKDGKQVKDAKGQDVSKSITKLEYFKDSKLKSCLALREFTWVHEEFHQKTCKALQKSNESHRWKNMEFYAKNDADAYKAGIDYLRQQTKELALKCGWEGSTGPTAVPTPKRADELVKNVQKAAQIIKKRVTKTGTRTAHPPSIAPIIIGVEIEVAPLEELIARWDTECARVSTANCDALGASIEVALIDPLRQMWRSGRQLNRTMLANAAYARLPQLARLALHLLHRAETPEEIEAGLQAADHPSPGIRAAAARILQGVDDARWTAIRPWRKTETDEEDGYSEVGDALGSGLIPDLDPAPYRFGMDSFKGLQFHYFGSTREEALFSTTESEPALTKRLWAGREVMPTAEALEKKLEEEYGAKAQAAILSGDSKKLDEIWRKFAQAQEQMNAMVLNRTENSTVIVLAKDQATGHITSTATIRRDKAWGRTVVTLRREGGWR